MYQRFFKRLFDVLVSGVLIILLWWLLACIAVVVAISSSGPVFFRGRRTGLNGTTFDIYKFRTMVLGSELGAGTTSRNDPRVTNVGRFLRKYKLDELPQLFNVFFGHMSIVGPRPELPLYTNAYEGDELIILSVKPGITDWASVKLVSMGDQIDDGDPDACYEQNFLRVKNNLRITYASNVTFWGDLTIIGLTLLAILKK